MMRGLLIGALAGARYRLMANPAVLAGADEVLP